MKVIEARNVQQAFPKAIHLLRLIGVPRESRNGPVLVSPCPVSTVYHKPEERVVFWSARDANPFFHLYEALWMLAGRNDVAPLVRYAKNIANYSDDGVTLHGAYGHRWRRRFVLYEAPASNMFDQLSVIARQLKENQEDRRNVLQIWDASNDLGRVGKDVPCNLTVTFQRDTAGRLDMVVFNRSNDTVWGCYGANAVHFSMLQEYLAGWIGCPVGTYTQVSANWHAYTTDLWERVAPLGNYATGGGFAQVASIPDPYVRDGVVTMPLFAGHDGHHSVTDIDGQVNRFLFDEARNFASPRPLGLSPFFEVAYAVFEAHALYRNGTGINRFDAALLRLDECPYEHVDWIIAAREWIQRRMVKALTLAKGLGYGDQVKS